MHKLILEGDKTRRHRERFQELLQATKGRVRIASAYVTDSELLLGNRSREVQLLTSLSRMDIVSGATSLACLRLLVESGVEVRHLPEQPRLHAKVYLFSDKCGVVTSANLTQSAFDRNIEVGAELSGDTVRQLTSWFDEQWKRSRTLGIKSITELERETAALRREYAKLRKRVGGGAGASKVAALLRRTNLRSTEQLRTFLCNSDRAHSDRSATGEYELEELMRTGYALAWEPFRYPDHMKQVQEHDAVLVYANELGIIGIGEATGGYETSEANSDDQIRRYPEREWRVPVNWLYWDAENPCPWKPHFVGTFLNVSDDKYRDRRKGIRNFVARQREGATI